MIPRFAEPIIEARKRNFKPAEMVLVSDGIADLRWRVTNPIVAVDPTTPARDYDFRCLADLEVEIVTNGSERRAKALVCQVAKAEPWYLRVRFNDTDEAFRIIICGEWDVRRECEWLCQ